MQYLGVRSDYGCKGDKVFVRSEKDGIIRQTRLWWRSHLRRNILRCLSFLFFFRIWFRNWLSLKSAPGRSTALLHHMSQLMGNQPTAFARPRREGPRTEHNVLSHGIGIGIYAPRRLLG